MHGLRNEYQDRINFVILNYDDAADLALARDLGIARHPAYGLLAPDSDEVVSRIFGPQPQPALRALLQTLIADHGG